MAEIVLPSVLHNSLCDLLSNNKLCSWNIHGGTKFTSLTIKFDNTQGSHVVSTGYRRKSPCELRRDEQRAALHRQQVLSSTPAEHAATSQPELSCSSVSQEDDRQSDNLDVCFGFTEAGTKAIIEEMRSISASFREDVRKMKDKEGLESSDLENDISDVRYDLSDSKVDEIMSNWMDKDVTFSLCSLKRQDQEAIIQSMQDHGPVIDTIVHDKRLGSNDLITRTKDFFFVYNIELQKVSDYRVISKQTNAMWPQRDYHKCLVNWPQCDKIQFRTEIDLLKTHVCAFYQSLIKNFQQ